MNLEGIARATWRYVRDLTFVDPADQTELRDWYRAYHKYLWFGFFAVSAIDLLAAPRGLAQITSAILTVTAVLLWAFA
jgi:hypothetical protein